MSIIVGILIGVAACHWVKVNAQAKQELIVKQAQLDILTQLARESGKVKE